MRMVSHGTTLALLATGCVLAGEPLAAQQTCSHPLVTVGIPPEYANTKLGEFRYELRGEHKRQVCAVVSFGTPYQLVSWLENGAVQSAVLSDFAVSVMRADDSSRFDEEYDRFPVRTLLTLPGKERRMLLTNGAGDPETQPDTRLDDFLTAVKRHEKGQSIRLPSHLSPAVPYLIRHATFWADEADLQSDEREDFFHSLLQAIRFGDPVEAGKPASTGATLQLFDLAVDTGGGERPTFPNELKGQGLKLSLGDTLVVRKRVLLASRELREIVELRAKRMKLLAQAGQLPAPVTEPEGVTLFATTPLEEAALGRELTRFRDTNYRRVQFSEVTQRHFRFTISELWTLLQRTDAGVPADSAGRLALVLTGGGVKAAYQTRMIDYLYDEKRLINVGDLGSRKSWTQQVEYVIGTSGGALLGIFVAAMDQNFNKVRSASAQNRLTAIIWKEPGPGIRSDDVFPFVDMMRYASLIMALVVVWIVSAMMLALFRSSYPQVKRFDHSDESFFGRRARAWRESWPWILIMLAAPIAILKVASVNRIEHVPIETGVYYAVMAMMAFYSDVRLYPSKPFTWRHVRLNWPTAVALLAAIVCITLAFARPAWLLTLSHFKDRALIFVNLCGLGFGALVLALHLFFGAQRDYFEPQPRMQILRAFAVLLGIVVLSYLAVSLAMWADATSLLELNAGFWRYFLLAAALLTAFYMWLGRAPSEHQARSFAQETLGYLFSEYRSRALLGSERRFMRFMMLNVLAWLWWNALAAPALYGNGNARTYLTGAFCRFTELAQRISPEKCAHDADEDDLDKAAEFTLAVPFVITATSLDKRQERYFLFVSGDDDTIDKRLKPDAWFNVVRDPRWVVVRKPVDKELQHAAFASGSPFPVFSAHDVQLRALKNRERLIDGGFAHNKPLEAARALGARKVLVLNSSPLEAAASGAQCTMLTLNLGELACNLPKLLPYLWERSQVEDVLSTRSMVVASIYPTDPDGSWPSLTDFRGKIVRDLIKDAEDDREARVGVIESWGAPQFTASAGLLGYDIGQIEGELKRITK